MWKYANTLFDTVFKKDGKLMTEAEQTREATEDPRAAAQRRLFADMLKALGFKIKYPSRAGSEPKPGLNAVYKKLIG